MGLFPRKILGLLFRPVFHVPEWFRATGLLLITLLSTTAAGAYYAQIDPFHSWSDFSQGLFFSVPLIMILLAHELGHYLMCRYHGIRATPPFFIPFPPSPMTFIPGTLGAFIKIKEPIPDRRALLEVGAGGPLAGLIMAVPIYIAGLVTSTPGTLSHDTVGVVYLGEPLLMHLLELMFRPGLAEGSDLMLNSVAFAGWFGFLVTMMNLMPVGQLDGGHICYALFGHKQEQIARWVTIVLLLFTVLWPGWLVWVLLTRFMTGLKHPPTLFDQVELAPLQRRIGLMTIVVLVLIFMPAPVSVPEWWDNWSLLGHELERWLQQLI